mgnify:FL=1
MSKMQGSDTPPAALTPEDKLLDWAIAVIEQDAEGDTIGTAAKAVLRRLRALSQEREGMVMVPKIKGFSQNISGSVTVSFFDGTARGFPNFGDFAYWLLSARPGAGEKEEG